MNTQTIQTVVSTLSDTTLGYCFSNTYIHQSTACSHVRISVAGCFLTLWLGCYFQLNIWVEFCHVDAGTGERVSPIHRSNFTLFISVANQNQLFVVGSVLHWYLLHCVPPTAFSHQQIKCLVVVLANSRMITRTCNYLCWCGHSQT